MRLPAIDEAEVIIPEVKDFHQGGMGGNAINGGVIAMLSDLALGLLGAHYWSEGFCATQHLSIDFVRPLIATRVTAHAKVEQIIGRKIFGEISFANQDNQVCAFAHGILVKGITK